MTSFTLRRSVRASVFVLAFSAAAASTLYAQAGRQQDDDARTFTAAEYSVGLNLYVDEILRPVSSSRSLILRADSVQGALGEKASRWISQLQSAPVKGIQLDPMGELFVAVGQDEIARQQFAERLATPGLSLPDKAYTLLLATRLFGNKPSNIERMRISLDYAAQLDAMPIEAISWQYKAHSQLARVYQYTGDGAAVIAHASKAFAMVPSIPFERREPVFNDDLYMVYADVISGQAGGTEKIDSVGQFLLSLTNPSAQLIAKDSAYYRLGWKWSRDFKPKAELAKHLGKPAPAIVATHWYNTTAPATASAAAPGAKSKALNDGVVRLIEFGEYACVPCRIALSGMERIRQGNPVGVEVWYSTKTEGAWGATFMAPDDEAKRLENFYVKFKGLGLPIALWAGPKDSTSDGGLLPREHPGFDAYPIRGTPTFIVTDGKGIVRHIAIGYSRSVERMLQVNIQYLLAEQKRTASIQ